MAPVDAMLMILPGVLGQHHLGRIPCAEERPSQIDVEDLVPIRELRAQQKIVLDDPGIVDKDVEPVEPLAQVLKEGLDLLRF